jgi:murein DD-endopeptidase MepM/ murein hydrolase activator NlpD
MQPKICARIILFLTVAFFVTSSFVSNCVGDTENVAGNGNETDASSHDLSKKRKSGQGKRAGLEDPHKLAEIIDKAIQVSSDTDCKEPSGLDLPVSGMITSKIGLRHDPINGDLRMHNG